MICCLFVNYLLVACCVLSFIFLWSFGIVDCLLFLHYYGLLAFAIMCCCFGVCSWYRVSCFVRVARRSLLVVRCSLFDVCWLMFNVLVFGVFVLRCLLIVGCLLIVACCVCLFACCCLLLVYCAEGIVLFVFFVMR